MLTSKYLLSTLKEIPSNADSLSDQLMCRSGMIRRSSSGFYIWLPTGLRILHNIERIIRQEMNKIGAIEISMPIIQQSELWKKSGRWSEYGQELFRLTDRTSKLFILSPTNEEVITNLIKNEVKSYKQLPLNLYQIQNKFRDEIRPRFGVIRSREFRMKDAYSFHSDQKSLNDTYHIMYQTYNSIFNRMKLIFDIIKAPNGSIGGKISHEFHALSNIKDTENISLKKLDSSNEENSKKLSIKSSMPKSPNEIMRLIETSHIHTISDLRKIFNLQSKQIVKIFIVHAKANSSCPLLALILRSDHKLNTTKAEQLEQIKVPLTFYSTKEIKKFFGMCLKSLGPVNLSIPFIIDHSVSLMSDFVAGANIDGKHFFGINWHRDLLIPEIADLKESVITDNVFSKKSYEFLSKKTIEIGHIFQLGNKYSKILNAMVQNKNNIKKILIMGCYGIGITRLIAAIVEQNHDTHGILWPEELAPFRVAIIPINMHKSNCVKKVSENIYYQLLSYNIDVLLDDRPERPGIMFADIELIGIPHIIIISDHLIKLEKVEYKDRLNNKNEILCIKEIIKFLLKIIK